MSDLHEPKFAPDEGDYLYVWQVYENGVWGVIASVVPGEEDGQTALMALVARNEAVSKAMGLIAASHHTTTGLPVRKARFMLDDILLVLP